jgi:Lon protease-like protein
VNPLYVPIFPLPDLTFFPHTLLPPHVFEARYRAMVIDALARDRRIAVVGLKPGYEAIYDGKPAVNEVAGVGRIARCERLATGRFNILLQGERRVAIERELPTDTLYRVVLARPLQEIGADRPGLPALARGVTERCLKVMEAVNRARPELQQLLESAGSPGELCDQVAAAVLPDASVRQRLLEELDVERRLERLTRALDDLLRQLTGER